MNHDKEPEPYVDLYVALTYGAVKVFPHVRGICVEYIRHAPPSNGRTERTLTFESGDGITNVFDVASWRTEATEDDVPGCSCGMADYGAPGHDGHGD